jgi:hypothetical protein
LQTSYIEFAISIALSKTLSRYIELSRWKLDPITHDIDHEETVHTNKMNKPDVKLRMLGRAGESKPGKASSNGVTSCN